MRLPQNKPHKPWPLYVLAAPATVAVWSGWVGLGQMTGFGVVHPLPGIADGFSLNTAITLPIGVESYAAYALGAWLSSRRLSTTTRGFAKYSALGALLLGGCGQIAYHLLEVGAAAGAKISAPVWITTIVACIPVVVLGLGATLAHLIHRDGTSEQDGVQIAESAETHPVTSQQTRSEDRSDIVAITGSGPGSGTLAPAGSEIGSADRSGEQVPDPAVQRSADRSDPQVSDPPAEKVPDPGKPKPRTRKRTQPKPKPLDRIDEARAADETYLAEHGRHIPAEKLASALRIGKPAALELVKQVRGAQMNIAK